MGSWITIVVLVFLSATIDDISAVRLCNSSTENWQSRIGVLISPLISGSMIREIEIYWNNINNEPGDRIALYEEDASGMPRIIYTAILNSSSGVESTGVRAEFLPSSNLSFVEKCLKYGVAWMSDKTVKRMNCLKTRPTWMKDRKHILGPRRVSEIFLPGTHDSAAYNENATRMSIFSPFVVTQDLNILGQLIHGARYLDIRVGYYRATAEKFWTNHSPIYRSVPLKTVVDQVKQFLDNTDEIVIMDVREFPIGFDNMTIHHALVSYLEDEFRDYYLANIRGWEITLNDIWSSGRRLIIGYENTRIVQSHTSMWPCVSHQWGDVTTVEDLYEYLRRVETSDRINRVRPRSAMAQLTASLNEILFNGFGDLREMAYSVNLNVTNWYSTIWQYTANIVAVDFVRGTDIVDIAIQSNENRHLYCL